MPLYRFEIVDGVRLSDPVGLQCDNNQCGGEGENYCDTYRGRCIAHRAPAGLRFWMRKAMSRQSRDKRPSLANS